MERIARIEFFARAGYAARALVYVLLGYLTLATRHSEGATTVLADIRALPAGNTLLIATGIGLFGYGVYRLYDAALDLQDDGTDAIGIGKRAGRAISGIAHLFLAYLALKLAMLGGGDAGQNGQTSAAAARTVLAIPGGKLVVVLIGAGFALAAFNQAVRAATGKFMALLDADAPGWTETIGRMGYSARAVVFALLAWNIVAAAFGGGTGDLTSQAALDQLRSMGWPYDMVAAGLLVFGVFSLVMARYRRIRDGHLMERLKRHTTRLI